MLFNNVHFKESLDYSPTTSGVTFSFFFFQAEDGIRDWSVTGVQTCALPICSGARARSLTSALALRRRHARSSTTPSSVATENPPSRHTCGIESSIQEPPRWTSLL